MSFHHNLIVLLSLLAFASAELSISKEKEDGWAFVPNRFGFPVRVNVTEVSALDPELMFNPIDDVKLELYTLENKDKPDILVPYDVASITSSRFDKNRPTRIYIHGWQEYAGNMKRTFNDAFLNKAKLDVNLIAVNWEGSSRHLDYSACAKRVAPIGSHVAGFIDFLVRKDLVDLEDITVIGFSLGAHIAGIVGKELQTGKLKKIVGLDPAGPLFSMDKPNNRLDKLDAEYVEVIHTSGTFLGFYDPIGTVNFYPNRGKAQAGCRLDITGICSHLRAFKYYAESLYSTISYYGYPCDTLDDVKKNNCRGVGMSMGGEPGNYRADAHIYYLETNTKSIFARGGRRYFILFLFLFLICL